MKNKSNLKLEGLSKAQFIKEFNNQWNKLDDLLKAYYCKDTNCLLLLIWDGITCCKYICRDFIEYENENKMNFKNWELLEML